MRKCLRRERPHLGARLRFTDPGGHRFTCFVTNTKQGQLADLELRHRRRARAEDRIRCAKDTGLRNLPLHDFTQNQIWCEIVALACDLMAWMQLLALQCPARRWEPKRLRLRLFAVAGRLVRGGRRLRLRITARWPCATQLITAVTRLQALPAPSRPTDQERTSRGPWNPAHPARQPGHHADQEAKSRLSQMHWPTTRRSRKIEVNQLHLAEQPRSHEIVKYA